MAERIVLRTGEALVEGDKDYLCAEPEIVLGELDGPVGQALATLIGDQVQGHTRVFALLNSDVQVKPATLMVSKVTVDDSRYTNILMGTVQAAIAHGVLDAVRTGVIPRERANDLGIIISVWLDPGVLTAHRLRSARDVPDAARGDDQGARQGDATGTVDRLAARPPGRGRALLPPAGAGRAAVAIG